MSTPVSPEPLRPPTPRKRKGRMIGIGCCSVLLLVFVFFWVIGTIAGPPPEAPKATASSSAPSAASTPTTTPAAASSAAPTTAPSTTTPAPVTTPAPTPSATTQAATTKAAAAGCEPASPALLEAVAGGLKDNDGLADPAAYPTKLTEGWVRKSDANDLWYVAAEVPGWNVTGVWVTTAPDGTGVIVSAETSAVSTSNWPDGPKAPKWEPVTGATTDIVIDTKACAG